MKTRVTFEEWRVQRGFSEGRYDHETIIRREAWYAALSNVVLPQGKRFEVGDRAVGDDDDPCIIVARKNSGGYWNNPDDVRPLPQTVELTVEEKREECVKSLMRDASIRRDEALEVIVDALANGQTLDQLCEQSGVATTREVV